MSPELNWPVYLAAAVVLQGMLTLWAYRASGSTPVALLVALLPPIGLPYLLWTLRTRLLDNHYAGGVSYLVLLGMALAFTMVFPEDETPWGLIYTMQIFSFLGVANLAGTQLKD